VWLSLLGNVVYYVFLASAVQLGGMAMTSLVIGFLPVAVSIIGSRGHGAVSLRKLASVAGAGPGGIACVAWQSLAGSAGGDMEAKCHRLLLRPGRIGLLDDLCSRQQPLAGTPA
jgi:drug/metabolite transporter (DMT)-like permease